MGMAASQARYLALAARRSNCEYEGQQINQARTTLANQSANLFNQMLGLSVPIPPSTQDFTKTQYSFTDGLHGSTMDSWQQLGTIEENYNYVVTHHYYADVYTGSEKKLTDPQVIFGKKPESTQEQIDAAKQTLEDATAAYNADPTNETNRKKMEDAQKAYDALFDNSVGNCKLSELVGELTKDDKAEIDQIIKDLEAQGIVSNLDDCFDDNGKYKGGIYTFTMNGVKYFTTATDLQKSAESGTGPNNIDGQQKLPYFNATYVSTKIEKTERALIETDSNGRFSSIKFESDSVTYDLKMETVTDDVAYEDAMNQYYYENAKYDKMVQDINAKTSIIQQQDLQLELRLKQLDTERNALQAEIEAVQKVVKDNVDKSFKTFGG